MIKIKFKIPHIHNGITYEVGQVYEFNEQDLKLLEECKCNFEIVKEIEKKDKV